jgi:superfamily II DNA or RNA helicase
MQVPKILNTYLGQKGYTIYKKELSPEEDKFIRKELTIKPYVPGSPANNTMPTFPAFRESDGKYYLPRYFGEKHFGVPKEIKIKEGHSIDLVFNGELRDNQKPVVEKYINHVTSYSTAGGLLELPCAFGKTSLSLYIASKLKKKTIVLVHKEFLMNQWIERIQQFLPNARIGKIQAQTIDIDDKDIVLGMIQSLSMKEYPASIFESFGFTIIDEVHHISSEVFSNTLFKLVTKYMLGLSATMNRKDGTTHVFKMFLGDVIQKVERKGGEHEVIVKAIEYKVDDDEFNNIVYDYRGNPQFSTMISKLCEYNHRTEFILKLLNDYICVDEVDKYLVSEHKKQMDSENPNCELCNKSHNYLVKNNCCDCVKYCLLCLENIVEKSKNNPEITINKKTGEEKSIKKKAKCPNCNKVLTYEQNYVENKYVKPVETVQTIILSHNLNILEYMYKKIVCKNLASVGYYVGGMKEDELKKSEKKQVILATYSMASEALDIPSLNTEFLITPKSDIEQCIGRILRAKHAITQPVVFDFIDSHDCFQKQWLKRKAFYKKQNYKIIQTNNKSYTPDINKWKIVFEPNLNGKKCISEDKTITKNDLPTGTCFIKLKK